MKTFFKLIFGVIIAWLGSVCTITALHEAVYLPRGILSCIFLGSLVIGMLIFCKWRFVPAYIFGHEMTHYFTAKIFLKKTGKIKLGKTSGSVEVTDSNVWIVLAPYIVPFYAFLFVLLYAIVSFFIRFPWLEYAFMALFALGYAYHIMLTYRALKLQQSDLNVYGPFLSMSIIFAGNAFQILVGILIISRTWKSALSYTQEIVMAQGELLHAALKFFH